MATFAAEWLAALWMILAESGPYLLVGFVIAGFLSVWVPAQWVARKLGGDDIKSVATAAIIGVPVPLCSCSVIPTATQLRRSGASRGATTSFLIATPETGVDSIGATWALMDPLMTVVRPLAAFVTAFASGVCVNLFSRGESGPLEQESLQGTAATSAASAAGADLDEASCCAHEEPPPPASCCAHEDTAADASTASSTGPPDPSPAAASLPGKGLRATVARALRYAFGTLLDDLTPWFLIGFALSGVIVIAVPDGFFTGAALTGWLAMLAMLAAGAPLYVCATASTPIAAAMMAKGLDPGAALVFLLAGPATNVATMLVVRNLLGKRALVIYLGSIAVMSLAIGWLVNRLYPMFGLDPTAMNVTPGTMQHGLVSTVAGAVLAFLLARSAWRLRLDRRFGAWARRVGGPVGLDVTATPFKLALGALAFALYASSAITAVRPGETVFVEQFGRVVASRSQPGAIVHLPWPLVTRRRVANDEIRALEFGIDRLDVDDSQVDALALREVAAAYKELRNEAEMLTGEGWLVSIEYAVHYRVVDSARWAYGFSEPERLLGRLAQEAIRRATATRRADDILVADSRAFLSDVESRLAESLADSGLGADLVGVQLNSVHAPPGVHPAFRRVASALIERETVQMTSERRRIERTADARMAAAETRQKATSEALRRVRMETGVNAGFEALAKADAALPGFIAMSLRYAAFKRTFDRGRSNRQRVIFNLGEHVEVVPMFGDGPAGAARTMDDLMKDGFDGGPR